MYEKLRYEKPVQMADGTRIRFTDNYLVIYHPNSRGILMLTKLKGYGIEGLL